ncbi:DDE-type integrase/transposase/recombinase, partial [Enterobacter hormaechei]|uniref:DDE-type integrase/transposase/recombinase n=1 Tax=Enterobacter hormaechei TaxID=158836 RepID=UPI0031D8B4C0
LDRETAHRQVKYLNNVIEADHGKLKILIKPVRGFKSRHCCKVSDEAAFCLIQRPYISKTLLTRRISPRGSP